MSVISKAVDTWKVFSITLTFNKTVSELRHDLKFHWYFGSHFFGHPGTQQCVGIFVSN